ncbi:acyltransferase [Flavobacterium sp.]|uniref:acyltransferase n=1 Tax=Flavobacterium sp. TaxID=239 RepID=UPI0025BE080A|nr:acyltransferase [Flavobacterium sp.]
MYSAIKSIAKIFFLKIRLRKVNYNNLHHLVHIGTYTLIKTTQRSTIQFNANVAIHDYVKLLAEDGGVIIFGEKVNIGDYSTIRASRATIDIGPHTMLGQRVTLISTNHAYKRRDQYIHDQDIDAEKIGIKIGADCWLGAGCIILPGVTIGNGAVIGAHAVVTKDIPDYSIAVGNPARVISTRT